ncbi:MAG: alpha/beta fold hydrolase, partial [Anaeroplasma sp.]|nr:alpha/beta fold hydrolase [Anaeroplasma sp.]
MKFFKKILISIFIIVFISYFLIELHASAQEDIYANTNLYNVTNTYHYKFYENSNGKKPILDENGIQTNEEEIIYDNDYRYDFNLRTGIPVETGEANITILTHGLNGDASHWSNNGNGVFAFNKNSIITRLYNIYNDANVYWLNFYNSHNFDLINITTQIENNTENNTFRTTGNKVYSITDITKHLIIVFDAYNSNGSNDDIYSQFNYGISNIVYQYKQLNNGVLPKINLIGHSRGGITNMQYALDHPDLIDSIYSIGTPYCGSTSASLDALWLHIFSQADGKDDIINEKVYTKYMNNWNNHYEEYKYDKINVLAIGGASTLNFLGKMLESDSSKYELINNQNLSPELVDALPKIVYTISNLLTTISVVDKFTNNIVDQIEEAATLALEACSTFNDLSDDYIDDIVRILCNELETLVIPPTTLVLNDIFVNLDSQLGIYNGSIENSQYLGYKGFNNKIRIFNEFDTDINSSAVNSISIPHNLEPKDNWILKQIIYDINVEQFQNSSCFETYYINENEVGILSYLGTNGTTQLNIPNTIDGKTVVEIGTHAFSDNSSVFNITLPNTIKIINDSAFENCTNLTMIDTTAAISLTSIGSNAFLNCSSLTTFTIPTNLNSLGTSVFLGSGVKTINNNSNNFEVDNNTLYTLGKTQLIFSPSTYQLTVPSTVNYIWPNAFSNNEKLRTIYLSNVENIGIDAFSGCVNLSIIENESGSLIYADKRTFADTPWFLNRGDVTILGSVLLDYKGTSTSYEIPSNVSYIALGAFNSSSLIEIYIGDNINTIAEYAFTGCSSLDRIYFIEEANIEFYHTSFPMNVEIIVPETIIRSLQNSEESSLYTISTYPININYYINGELYLTDKINFYGEIPDIGAKIKGYTFDGWLYDGIVYKTGAILDIFSDEINLEAKLIPNTYIVDLEIFYRLTGTFGKYLPSSSAHIIERDGYVFMGWYTEDGVCYINDIGKPKRIWDIDEDTVLYAKWSPITYNITYDLNGGEHTT